MLTYLRRHSWPFLSWARAAESIRCGCLAQPAPHKSTCDRIQQSSVFRALLVRIRRTVLSTLNTSSSNLGAGLNKEAETLLDEMGGAASKTKTVTSVVTRRHPLDLKLAAAETARSSVRTTTMPTEPELPSASDDTDSKDTNLTSMMQQLGGTIQNRGPTAPLLRPQVRRGALSRTLAEEELGLLRVDELREAFRLHRDRSTTPAALAAARSGVNSQLLTQALAAAELPVVQERQFGNPPVTRRVAMKSRGLPRGDS